MVPKLDRLARAVGDDLAARGIKLSLGGQVYDRADPIGKMFFNPNFPLSLPADCPLVRVAR